MTSDLTQIPKIYETGYQGSTTTDEDLIQRLEELTNQTGQLNKDSQGRPNKYNIQIRDLGEKEYHLKEPLLVTVEEYSYDEVFIVSYPEIEAFGEGVTEAEAIANLKKSILDLFDELSQTPEDELGVLPKTWLNILNSLIKVDS